MRRKNPIVLLCMNLLLFCSSARGQTSVSAIRGTVLDSTGAVVVAAEIKLINLRTNLERTVQSNESGDYEILDLQNGVYRLTATAPGFATFVADDIILESSQIRRVDIRFEVGAVTTEVTISSDAAVIETDTGTVTTQFQNRQFKDVPLLGILPSPTIMMGTLAGVQPSGYYPLISGQPRSQISDSMDGIPRDRLNGLSPSINANEEVKVVAVNATADLSRVASYNAVSKSGGNDFHAAVFYKHVNGAWNAREFFDTVKPRFLSHEWMAEASGPIKRDRTFFYAAFVEQLIPSSSFRRGSVPTLRMRGGDFSQFSTPIKDPMTGELFPNNTIPASRLNSLSLKTQEDYYPKPNLGGSDQLTDNFGFLFPYPSDYYKADFPLFRVDHKLSDKNSLFFKYSYYYSPYVLPAGGLPGFDRTRERFQDRGVISNTHIFSPTVVNTFRFGFTGNDIKDGQTVDGFTPYTGDEVVRALGLQGVNPSGLSAMGFPRMRINGLTSLEMPPGGTIDDNYDFSFDNSLSWVQGRHVLKFGVQVFDFNDFDSLVSTGTYGDFNFDGSLTGIGYADFLLGLPLTSTRLDPLVNRWKRASEVGLYVMDTFKVNQKLTLDYGVRWDYYGSPSYEDGLQYNWDATTGNVVVPEQALSRVSPLYPSSIRVVTGQVIGDAQVTNIRPRVGFAYRPRGDLVIRGGYGVFTERISLGYFDRLLGGGPFEISETYFNSIQNGQPLFAFPNPFPTSTADARVPSQSVSGYPLETDHGSIQQFNLSIEKQLKNLGFRVSYIGSRSRGFNYSLNINKPQPSTISFTNSRRPFPQFVNATFWESDGKANFDSLQFEVRRRTGDLSFDGHYTFSSNRANYLNLEDPYNHHFWNRIDFTSTHRAVISLIYDLPFGSGKRFLSNVGPLGNHVIGGWQFYAIAFWGTGVFFSPQFSGSDPSRTNTFGGLPDRIGEGGISRGERTVERWFDPAAFVVPPAGRFGNSGVNILQGPGYNVQHLSVRKNFNLGERLDLVYTLRITNLFNHPHFQNPRNSISAPGTGSLFQTVPEYWPEQNAARRLQMELRLEW